MNCIHNASAAQLPNGETCKVSNSTPIMDSIEVPLPDPAQLPDLTGRKVRDPKDCRTNLYIIGVAPTCWGKESARKSNLKILTAAVAEKMLGESLGSASGLANAVAVSPAILFQIDEMGQYLQSVGSAKNAILDADSPRALAAVLIVEQRVH